LLTLAISVNSSLHAFLKNENVLVYLFYPNFYDIICRSSTPVALSEREVEWLGDSITARKYCLYIPEDRSKMKGITFTYICVATNYKMYPASFCTLTERLGTYERPPLVVSRNVHR